jgi:hypothetical protein
MKRPPLLPALLLLPATVLLADHETIFDASGSVAVVTVNLTLSETVGGNALTEQRREAEFARGAEYPEATVFSRTYTPDALVSAVLNPFGWNDPARNHYVERVTTDNRQPAPPVVTAAGSYSITRSRYTNATLLNDLVAAGKIPSAAGYRIVAVSLDLDHEVHFTTTNRTENYTTHVNNRLYFFAERGADDPAPVFLGAEYKDIYIYDDVIGLDRHTTIQSGRYVDTFTGRADGGGFDYAPKSQTLSGRSAGEFVFFRPAPAGNFYLIRAAGIFRWSERYDARRGQYISGAITGTGLAGPAQGYFGPTSVDTVGHDHANEHTYTPNATNQAVVNGSVSIGAAQNFPSMLKYMNHLPPVMPH